MHLSAKYIGAREPTFADADIILPTVVFGKREEAAKTISDETRVVMEVTTLM